MAPTTAQEKSQAVFQEFLEADAVRRDAGASAPSEFPVSPLYRRLAALASGPRPR